MLVVYTSFGRSGFTPKGKAGVKVGLSNRRDKIVYQRKFSEA